MADQEVIIEIEHYRSLFVVEGMDIQNWDIEVTALVGGVMTMTGGLFSGDSHTDAQARLWEDHGGWFYVYNRALAKHLYNLLEKAKAGELEAEQWKHHKKSIRKYVEGDYNIHFGLEGYSYEDARTDYLKSLLRKVQETGSISGFNAKEKGFLFWAMDPDRAEHHYSWSTGKRIEYDRPPKGDFKGGISRLIWTILKKTGSADELLESHVVREVIDSQYDFSVVRRLVTNKVNDLMQSGRNVGISIPSDFWNPVNSSSQNSLADIRPFLMKGGGEEFNGKWAIGTKYAAGEFIPNWKLTPKDVVIDGESISTSNEFHLGKLDKQLVYFPRDYKEPTSTDGEASWDANELEKEMQEQLASFDKFAGEKNITEYPFQFNTTVNKPRTHYFVQGGVEWFVMDVELIHSMEDQLMADYTAFIMAVWDDWKDGNVTDTVENIFNKTFGDAVIITYYYKPVLIDKEMARRVQYWKNLARLLFSKIPDEEKDKDPENRKKLEEEDIENALRDANNAFLEGEPPPNTPLEEDAIEGRRKFFKQCALMLNAHMLKEQMLSTLKTEATKGRAPFDGRFWMARCDTDQERLINNLVASEDGAAFFDVPPSVLSYLVPKIRLYRVENEEEGWLEETEFVFDQSSDVNRNRNYTKRAGTPYTPENFLAATFDKGSGCGLKEFSFEYNGTNPAEARNDIKARLSLYFQSFGDFVRQRLGSNGMWYRYVDLVLQPTENQAKSLGLNIVHPHQYDPSFFRIRAEVGYVVPDNLETAFANYDSTALRRAITRSNRSMYLVMVDHEIKVNNDGSVLINIDYRAYVETALKSLRFDALATTELLAERNALQKGLYDILSSQQCTKSQVNEYKAAMQGKEEEHKQKSLQSIFKRLLARGKIYVTKVNTSDAQFFRNNGYFSNCELQDINTGNPIEAASFSPNMALQPGQQSGALSWALRNNLPEEGDFDYTDMSDTTIQYFFFGDLLHTIMDTMYDSKTLEWTAGMENTRIILGSFDFDPFTGKGADVTMNIAQLPISTDFFMKWFTENVLTKGKTRKTFPILSFIRNLSNTLLQDSLLETCVNKKMKKTTRFQTGQISAYAKEIGKDPFGMLVNASDLIVNTDHHLGINLPLMGDAEQEIRSDFPKAQHFYNYLILNVIGSSLTYTGNGNYADDIKKGRYHIEIGSNRGIVKTVSFAKTDMQYVREARFMQQGIDGLMQLSAVYKASIEMFGNTLFYPGMELYINPFGIGGTTLGSPTQGPSHSGGRSLANKLGLGGYHTILSVKSSITPGKFTTSLQAQQYYSGDGQGNPNIGGIAIAEDELKSLTVTEEQQESIEGAKDYCDDMIKKLYNNEMAVEQTPGVESLDESRSEEQTSIETTSPVTSTPLDGTVYSSVFFDSEGSEFEYQFDVAEPPVQTTNGTMSRYTLKGITVAEEQTYIDHPNSGDLSVRLVLYSETGDEIHWNIINESESITDDQDSDSLEEEEIMSNGEFSGGSSGGGGSGSSWEVDTPEDEIELPVEESQPSLSAGTQEAEELIPDQLGVMYKINGDIWTKTFYTNGTDNIIPYPAGYSSEAEALIRAALAAGVPVFEIDEGVDNSEFQEWLNIQRGSSRSDKSLIDYYGQYSVRAIHIDRPANRITITYQDRTVKVVGDP